MRTMAIDTLGAAKAFIELDGKGKATNTVFCAFDKSRFCAATCAACEISGSSPKAHCTRNGGNDNDFMIGHIKEDAE